MEMHHSSRQISESGGIHLFNGAVLAALTWRLPSMTALSSLSAALIARTIWDFPFKNDSKENLPMEMHHSLRQIPEHGGIHLSPMEQC
jgi:hypothetical protein